MFVDAEGNINDGGEDLEEIILTWAAHWAKVCSLEEEDDEELLDKQNVAVRMMGMVRFASIRLGQIFGEGGGFTKETTNDFCDQMYYEWLKKTREISQLAKENYERRQ